MADTVLAQVREGKLPILVVLVVGILETIAWQQEIHQVPHHHREIMVVVVHLAVTVEADVEAVELLLLDNQELLVKVVGELEELAQQMILLRKELM